MYPKEFAIDSSYCRFGAEAILKLLKAIDAQIEGVEKNEDIEYVHKMRVSSRRIRAAMPLFKECFPKKRFKRWLGEIKKVTKFLGEARDLDVQIFVIKTYIEKLEPLEPKEGMEILLKQLVNQRANIQSNVNLGIKELKASRVLQQISDYCEQIIKETATTPFNLFEVRERAFWQISCKLDQFLDMEVYVHKEEEILKHHEMRIKAKWLRYTMEAFAPLYQEELSEEIKKTKEFQDILGEMHDCDVWIEFVPKLIQDIQRENANRAENTKQTSTNLSDLDKFVDHIKARKKDFYLKFVALWDERKKQNAFEEIRKSTSAGFVAGNYRIKAELANPYVKIAVIANVHANLYALEAVLKDAQRRGVTVFLNAGDLLGFGVFPNEVIQKVYLTNVLSVIGNSDIKVLERNKINKDPDKFILKYTRKILAKSYEMYIRTLSEKLELEIGRKKLLMVHSISNLTKENSVTDEPLKTLAEKSGKDIIIFGHTHEPSTKKILNTIFVNPGSVGVPIDGNPKASYALITVNPFSVELIRVSYDVEAAADSLRRKGGPESYAQMLLRGLSLEKIVEEDKAKEKDMEERCPVMAKSSFDVSEKYCPDLTHVEQVRKLSIQLFDGLQELHHFGTRERCWLECAAILHDIGLALGTKRHQIRTLKLILNQTQLPFTSVERQIIGNIARYHRKRGPKKQDYSYMSLTPELRRKTVTLSGILRLADSLDFSHQSIVEKVEVHTAFEYVTVEGFVHQSPVVEEYSINKKKGMIEQFLKKKVAVAWKQVQLSQRHSDSNHAITQEPPSTNNIDFTNTINSSAAERTKTKKI